MTVDVEQQHNNNSNIELIVHQRWKKTELNGKKPDPSNHVGFFVVFGEIFIVLRNVCHAMRRQQTGYTAYYARYYC